MNNFIKMIKLYTYAIFVWETNRKFICTTYGEPRLGDKGLWGDTNIAGIGFKNEIRIIDILVLCDKKNDLISISNKINCKYSVVVKYIDILSELGLIREI